MSIVSRCAVRLIAAGAFAVIIPAVASAFDIERTGRFELAMGPMSAAQKNQGQGMAEQSGSAEVKPRDRIKHHHHRVKHRRRHHAG
jgi:hypothetical protein